MRRILVATGNAHKTREIRQILGREFEVDDLTAHPEVGQPEETGVTFKENAEIKAKAASGHFDGLVISDDSGLEVDALGGAPGVRSARFAGPEASDEDNRVRLLRELEGTGAEEAKRSARFHCVMAVARRGEILTTFDGVVEGVIAEQPRGTGGFGYDPLFVPEGYSKTFAELPVAVKNRESHRARALRKLAEYLKSSP